MDSIIDHVRFFVQTSTWWEDAVDEEESNNWRR